MSATPLTTKQAEELYTCEACKAGDPCETECLESATCSMRCTKCNQRIWFQGNLWDTPKIFRCPYCNSEQTSRYSKQKPK